MDPEEEIVKKSKSDRDDLHKRKNIKMTSGVYDNRLLRAIKNDERRKSARRDMLDMKRHISDEDDSETEEEEVFEDCKDTPCDEDPEKLQENKNTVCSDEEQTENVCDTEDCETTEDTLMQDLLKFKARLENYETSVVNNPINENSDNESKVIETTNDAADISADDHKLKESLKISENKISVSVSFDCKDEASKPTSNKIKAPHNGTKTDNVNLKAQDLKPVKKAPTNDRREKLQQYLAEKKKLAQVKRKNDKPAFRTTGKIQHDLGPVGAHKPNIYSIGGAKKENASILPKNGSFVSRKGSCVSRNGSTLSRNVSRTGPNVSRNSSNMSRPGSNTSKNDSSLSKEGSTLPRPYCRSNSTLSRKTLTMIR